MLLTFTEVNKYQSWLNSRERSHTVISRGAKCIRENHCYARQPFHSHGQPRLCPEQVVENVSERR